MQTNTKYLIVSVALLMAGCAGLPDNTDRSISYALTDTDDTVLGRESIAEQDKHPGKSGFFLLDNGLDAFVARAVLAEAAEKSLDLQYYLYHNDLIGNLLGYSLLKAADRGVRVRLLVDDMGLAGRDVAIAKLASHPNIEIRIFNPFSRNYLRVIQFVTRFGDVTRRMHNKSFTVDNQITVVGGRNIGNEYFDADPTMAFGDLDVIAVGPVVKEVSKSFDEYWNSPLSYPVETLRGGETSFEELEKVRPQWEKFIEEQKQSEYYLALFESDLAILLREKELLNYTWGQAKALYDNPEKIVRDTGASELHLGPQLEPVFETLENELIIFTAYFVPGKEGTKFFKSLTDKGIRVRIVTNSLASTDVTLVHAGYSKYRKALLLAGVELYEVKKTLSREEKEAEKGKMTSSKASLHAKAFILDRKNIFIGSLNLDPRSFDQNTEIGILFESPEMGEDIAESFDSGVSSKTFKVEIERDEDLGYDVLRWVTRENGESRTYTDEPHASFWQKLLVYLGRLLPIESQL